MKRKLLYSLTLCALLMLAGLILSSKALLFSGPAVPVFFGMAYASAPFHGKLCRVRKNSVNVAYTTEWSINAQVDMSDQSAQGDTWKTGLAGLASWSGSMKMYFVPGNTEQKALLDELSGAGPGTKLTDVVFVQDAQANQFTGNIFLTSMAIPGSMGGVVTLSFNFQGDGQLSITNAGS